MWATSLLMTLSSSSQSHVQMLPSMCFESCLVMVVAWTQGVSATPQSMNSCLAAPAHDAVWPRLEQQQL